MSSERQRLAVQDVLDERDRQDELWGDIPDRVDELDWSEWVAILTEEVGEFAEAVLEHHYGDWLMKKVRREAVQVTAVGLSIVEAIDHYSPAAREEEPS